jgi:hypothetical protein
MQLTPGNWFAASDGYRSRLLSWKRKSKVFLGFRGGQSGSASPLKGVLTVNGAISPVVELA